MGRVKVRGRRQDKKREREDEGEADQKVGMTRKGAEPSGQSPFPETHTIFLRFMETLSQHVLLQQNQNQFLGKAKTMVQYSWSIY